MKVMHLEISWLPLINVHMMMKSSQFVELLSFVIAKSLMKKAISLGLTW